MVNFVHMYMVNENFRGPREDAFWHSRGASANTVVSNTVAIVGGTGDLGDLAGRAPKGFFSCPSPTHKTLSALSYPRTTFLYSSSLYDKAIRRSSPCVWGATSAL